MKRLAAVLAASALPLSGAAQDIDDILSGFDAPAPAVANTGPLSPAEPTASERFRVSGIIGQRVVVHAAGQAAPHDGLASLKSQIALSADLDLGQGWKGHVDGRLSHDSAFAARDRTAYTPEFLEAYESESEIGEAYVLGGLGANLDLKLGRQIVVWGKSDAIRVTDILNPLDMREPGLTEIRDLRLPVTMARLDWYGGDWNLSGIVIPEVRFNKIPVLGSDFYPGTAPPPPDDAPGEGFGSPEYALALNGTFPGWDLSLYAASVYNDAPHVEATVSGPRRRHARLGMIGAAAAVSRGNWLWKAEAAVLDGLRFQGAPGQTFRRADVLVGFDYTGLSIGTVTVEAANRHLVGFRPVMAGGPEDAREDEFELALRFTTTFLHDRLALNAVASVLGTKGQNGGFQRIEATYDLGDRAKLALGAVNYVSGDKAFFRDIADNDRIYGKVEYRF